MDLMSNDHRIKSVLGRLEMIIDNENDNIGKDPQFDFKVSNAHKSRCLYELTMLFRDAGPLHDAEPCSHIEHVTKFAETETPDPPLVPRGSRAVS